MFYHVYLQAFPCFMDLFPSLMSVVYQHVSLSGSWMMFVYLFGLPMNLVVVSRILVCFAASFPCNVLQTSYLFISGNLALLFTKKRKGKKVKVSWNSHNFFFHSLNRIMLK